MCAAYTSTMALVSWIGANLSWYVYQRPLTFDLLPKVYCKANCDHCLSTSNLYSPPTHKFHKPRRWELTHEESQATSCPTFWEKWLSFPSSKLGLNILYVCSFSTTSKSVYIFFWIQFLHACLIRFRLLLAFYHGQRESDDHRLLFGFQIVHPCFAQKSDIFLRWSMPHLPLVASISPLAST